MDHGNLLKERLLKIGMELNTLDRFIVDLMEMVTGNPSIKLSQINNNLKFFGWEMIALDYYTFQIAVDYFQDFDASSYGK